MKLSEIVGRKLPPAPWEEGEKIPWHEPGFSERMLKYHLAQDHDLASRRLAIIELHVDWIEERFLDAPSRVLDLGCGPGLYAHLLAERGHACVGLDISPASITHAKKQAEDGGLSVTYQEADIRYADYGDGFDLAQFIFGEFNVFRREEAEGILRKAADALKPGGHVLVECHTFDEVKRQGEAPPFWQACDGGLFAETPHLWLEEHFWHPECSAATTRYLIVEAPDGEVTAHSSTMQAYTDEEYVALFEEAGFTSVQRHDSMGGAGEGFEGRLQVFTARKAG